MNILQNYNFPESYKGKLKKMAKLQIKFLQDVF